MTTFAVSVSNPASSGAVHEFRCVCGAAIAIPGRFSLVAQQPSRTLSAGRPATHLRTRHAASSSCRDLLRSRRSEVVHLTEQAGTGVAMICGCYFSGPGWQASFELGRT